MPGIVGLVALISLDVTTALVAANYTAPFSVPGTSTLSVAAATNATPIVITTTVAHGLPSYGSHVVVSGVGGNAAANNLDSDGVTNNAWLAVPTTDTAFALYSLDPSSGARVASVGSGAYSSGGTVKQALVDGRILMGRQHIFEQSAPPRIVFVPKASRFSAKDVYSRSNSSTAAEQLRQTAQRSLATDAKTFEVHCWGAASSPAPDDDFDATEVLYQQVIRSTHLLLPGTRELGSGQWADQTEAGSQLVKSGHWFVFTLSIDTPVLGVLLPRAPSDVSADSSVLLDIGDGSPEPAVTHMA